MNADSRVIAIAIAIAGVGIAPPVSAESDAVCRAYANQAVASFQESQRLGCGFLDARWQGNRDAHYGWCRTVSAEAVNSESTARADRLRVCRREPAAVECDKYAIMASSDQRSNLGGNCGFTGARWQANDDAHLHWCLGVPIEAANRELAIRNAMLGVCGRNPNNLRCDAYARRAVDQVREAGERNCSFSGPRWTPLYEDHLTWCLGQPPEAADNESREREGPLSQCRTQLPNPVATEACNWSAVVRTDACRNQDGTMSDRPPGSMSNIGCGATQDIALDRAKTGLSSQAQCLSDDDPASPGCCTYTTEVVQGCQCH